ncbi:ABC transporter permease subunit [Thermodesulfobacteriota bacterium]
MYKALIWKEYRETRLPLALTILSCSILSWILYSTVDQGSFFYLYINRFYLGESFFVIIVLLIIFYAAMTGSEAFASEYQAKTFDYLVSRAVSREKLWICKSCLRISTLLPPFAVFFFINKYTLLSERTNFQTQCMILLSTLFIFSACFFFSTIFNRPVKAGVCGLIVFLGYAGLFAYFSESYLIFVITCFILSVLIFFASFIIFTKGKITNAV